MRLFQSMKSTRMFYYILTLLLAMAVAMFLLTFFFLHTYLEDAYQRRAEENAMQFLGTAGEYVDLAVLDLGRAMGQLLWNTDVTGAILVPDEVSYARKVEIVKALSTFEQDHPLVERAYLLTYGNDTLYDGEGNSLSLKDAAQRSYLPEYNANVRARAVADEDFATTVITVDGAVALLQDFPTPERNGALLVEVREELLLHFLEAALEDTSGYIEVLDPSGALIWSCGEKEGAGAARPFMGKTGWTFSIRQGLAQTELTLEQVVRLIGLWILMFGVVGAAAALLVSWRIYRPIYALRSVVEDGGGSGEGENELEMVRRVYEATLRQKDSLSDAVAEMAPIVRDRLYKNLLLGRPLSGEYLMDRLAYLHSPLRMDGSFSVLVCATGEEHSGSLDELMGALYRRLSQQDEKRARWECVLMDDYSLVVILILPEQAAASAFKRSELELERRVQEFARQNAVQDALVMGLGKPCSGVAGLHWSYTEALEDLHYRQYHGGDVQEGVHSPVGGSRELLELAMGGDVGGARRALEVLCRLAREGPDSERRAALGGMADSMVEALLGLHAPEEKLSVFDAYYRQADSLDAVALETLALEVGEQGIALLSYYGQKNRNRYVAQAQKYIQERCTDSHLSLDMVAESVGINPAYLSRLFYELSEVNFVNYVNGCRVERAKLLLRQSKIPVQEVGFRSGFNSLQNFNRVFKRHTGMTPGAYRKQEGESL